MNNTLFIKEAMDIFDSSPLNYIPEDKALSPELAGVKIYEPPLISFASARDEDWLGLKEDNVVGAHFLLPKEWLPSAKSVISFFFPFTETVRESNKQNMVYPSSGWLNARIEGQVCLSGFGADLLKLFEARGEAGVVPTINKRFITNTDNDKHGINKLYTSNWSERHVAYVCGLGTFALSKGFITEKGMSGRFTSIITSATFAYDEKSELGIYENCIMCGKCAKNCPVGAISKENGKDHVKCSEFVNSVLRENAPYYGCGKCQVDVPCENKNPRKNFKKQHA